MNTLVEKLRGWLWRDTTEYVWSKAQLAEHYDWIKANNAYPVDIPSGGYFVRNIKGQNIKPPKD